MAVFAAERAAEDTRRNEEALATLASGYLPDYLSQACMHVVCTPTSFVECVSLQSVFRYLKGEEHPIHLGGDWVTEGHCFEAAELLLCHATRTRLSRSNMEMKLAMLKSEFGTGSPIDQAMQEKLKDLRSTFSTPHRVWQLHQLLSGAQLVTEPIKPAGDCWALMMMAGHEITFKEAKTPTRYTLELVRQP